MSTQKPFSRDSTQRGNQYYYWDACPFSAVFNKEPGRVENCRQVLKSAESGEIKIVTSAKWIASIGFREG
jgi:hypothetical protein